MIEYSSLKNSRISDKDWDDFVDQSDNGTIFHKRKFLSYHAKDKFNDASFVVFKDSNILSAMTAALIRRDNKLILSSHPGASYGSFVYRSELSLKEAHEIVESLIDYGSELNVDSIQLTLPPMIYQKKYSNYLDFALTQNGFSYLKREVSSVVQLDVEKEKLLYTFRPEARTATKKAISSNVEIVETERFAEYYEILKKGLKMRHNVSPAHSLEELIRLKELFPTKIRLWGAFVDGKLIAGVCNFNANNNVVLAFYISHLIEYQNYRPVNVLFYEIMHKSREEGLKFLDFGIFTVNMEPNWGLARFKENFGARGIFRDTFIKHLK
ncbi:MAG: GNAT family N-acetyltransferase [Ignavibacteriaceae bacterium]|nr:GNAT family N-acetyltransferase [Ignavibacteriaceae bacterium]